MEMMTGEAFLAKSRGLCEEGAWHGLFCTPRVVMSAPAVSFIQWAVSLVATNCAGQWLSRIFRDRLLPLPAGGLCHPITSSRQAGSLSTSVESVLFHSICPHLLSLIKDTHPLNTLNT